MTISRDLAQILKHLTGLNELPEHAGKHRFNSLMSEISKSNAIMPTISGKKPTDNPIRTKTRAKITPHDVKEMARLIAECRLTESEASNLLDIPAKVWFNWKCKPANKLKFEDIFTRIKASKITNCIESINRIGDGIGMKQPDWRAKHFILQITAPDRFNLNKESSTGQAPTVNIQIMSEALKRIYSNADNQIIESDNLNSLPSQTVTRFLPVRNT